MKLFSRSRQMLNRGCAAALATATLLLPGALRAEQTQIDPANFNHSFAITFPGYAGEETLTDFPALVRLSVEKNDFRYSKCPNGESLRFADADGNLIPHEIDTWNITGESLVWVKVPSLTAATTITAYYGWKGEGTIPENVASNVWSNGYVGVWHLGEDGLTFPDSTTNGLDFSCAQNHADYVGRGVENGAVGKSVEFGGVDGSTNGGLSAEDSDLLDGFQTVTFEFWTYQTTHVPGRNMTLLKKQGSDNTTPFRFYQNNNDPRTIVGFFFDGYEVNGSASTWWGNAAQGSGTIPLDQWNHQAYTYNWKYSDSQSRSYGYLNGTQIASRSASGNYTFPSNDGKLCLGNEKDSSTSAYVGRMDEFRISNVARSADWVKATYDTVHNDEFALYRVSNEWKRYAHTFSVSFPGATNGVLSAFPVLVKVSESSIPGFRYADCLKEDGEDLRFADENGNLLDCEVDTWDTNGVSLVWVNVPSLTSGTTIKAYYGWDFAPSVEAMNVWTNGYLGVWHLNEASSPLTDSTGGGKNFTRSSSHVDMVSLGGAGIVGNAPEFAMLENQDGTHDGYLKLSDSNSKFAGKMTMTFEMWLFQKEAATNRRLLYKKLGNDTALDFTLTTSSGKQRLGFAFLTTNTLDDASSAVTKTLYNRYQEEGINVWRYCALVYDSVDADRLLAYVNGKNSSSTDDSVALNHGYSVHPNGGDLYLGNLSSKRAFPGKIDEVRISNVARSPEWLRTTYDMIKGNANFSTYGNAKANKTGSIVYFK